MVAYYYQNTGTWTGDSTDSTSNYSITISSTECYSSNISIPSSPRPDEPAEPVLRSTEPEPVPEYKPPARKKERPKRTLPKRPSRCRDPPDYRYSPKEKR